LIERREEKKKGRGKGTFLRRQSKKGTNLQINVSQGCIGGITPFGGRGKREARGPSQGSGEKTIFLKSLCTNTKTREGKKKKEKR